MSQRSRAELRDLLLDAGAALIERDGIGLELAEITYGSVFDHLETTQGVRVTRASVHKRIWPSQRAFQLEVLAEAVRRWDGGDDEPDVPSMLLDALADPEAGEPIGDGTIEGLLDHLCKTVGIAALEGFSAARSWRMFNALWSLFEATPVHERDDLADFAAQVRDTYRGSLERDRASWQAFVDDHGLPVSTEVEDPAMAFSMMSSALLDGAYLTRFLWPDGDRDLTEASDGWTPFAVGLRGLADGAVDTGPDSGGPDDADGAGADGASGAGDG